MRPAVVSRAIFLGSVVHIEVTLTNGDATHGEGPGREATGQEMAIAQIAPDGETFHVGDHVHLWWNASDEVRFPQ